MIGEKLDGLRVLRFPTLRRTGINCALSTVPLDVRQVEGRTRLAQAVGLDPALIATPRQVHHAGVARADSGPLPDETEADCVITDVPGQPILLRAADCSLVIVVDPENRAFGIAHAGWKGSVRGVVVQMVRTLAREYGTLPGKCRAAIAPTITWERYPVGPEVPAAFIKHRKWAKEFVHHENGHLHFDLRGANKRFLMEAGIPEENIEICRMCTLNNPDLLHSYRRDGTGSGHHGLIAAFPE